MVSLFRTVFAARISEVLRFTQPPREASNSSTRHRACAGQAPYGGAGRCRSGRSARCPLRPPTPSRRRAGSPRPTWWISRTALRLVCRASSPCPSGCAARTRRGSGSGAPTVWAPRPPAASASALVVSGHFALFCPPGSVTGESPGWQTRRMASNTTRICGARRSRCGFSGELPEKPQGRTDCATSNCAGREQWRVARSRPRASQPIADEGCLACDARRASRRRAAAR